MSNYVLGACSLVVFLCNEPGADIVTDIIKNIEECNAKVSMNSINLLEVFAGIQQKISKEKANEVIAMVKKLPIFIQTKMTDEVFVEAGRLRATYNLSLADSIALAEASVYGDVLLVVKHQKYKTIEKQENINFYWVR